MPLYEYQCNACASRQEIFVRSMTATVSAPTCTRKGCKGDSVRVISRVVRRLTEADQMAEAEAKFGKQVNDVLGPSPDVGKHARRYERLSKDLPAPNDR
jgi:putative FmdB family regulatory protein